MKQDGQGDKADDGDQESRKFRSQEQSKKSRKFKDGQLVESEGKKNKIKEYKSMPQVAGYNLNRAAQNDNFVKASLA